MCYMLTEINTSKKKKEETITHSLDYSILTSGRIYFPHCQNVHMILFDSVHLITKQEYISASVRIVFFFFADAVSFFHSHKVHLTAKTYINELKFKTN